MKTFSKWAYQNNNQHTIKLKDEKPEKLRQPSDVFQKTA